MNPLKLFSESEVANAERRLQVWTPRSVSRFVWFYNSIQVFLRDVERRRGSHDSLRLLSCDASEVISYASPNELSARAFNFGGLVTESIGISGARSVKEVSLKNLDRLITHHLLFDRAHGHLILDPHLQEVFLVEQARKEFRSDLEIKFEQILEEGRVDSLSLPQLQRIRNWIDGANKSKQPAEFAKFRSTFLPGWRSELAALLDESAAERNRIRHYIDSGRHYLLAPDFAGEKSIVSLLHTLEKRFDWKAFLAFSESREHKEEFAEIVDVFVRVASLVPRARRGTKHNDEATRRDAKAIAILHVVNSFLHQQSDATRIELVTRSQMVHMVMASLPEGRLRVSVRHPLLVPEIYNFDQNALETFGAVFQTLDGVLSPFLDAYAADGLSKDMPPIEQAMRQIASPIVQLVEVLLDSIAVQQTLERSEIRQETIRSVLVLGSRTGSESPDRLKARDAEYSSLAREIESTFNLISRKLRERGDPFSSEAIYAIGQYNRKLLDSDRARIKTQFSFFRILLMPPCSVGKGPAFIAARITGGKLPRVFHFHSSRMATLLSEGAKVRVKAEDPIPVKLLNSRVFDLAKQAFTELETAADRARGTHSNVKKKDLLYNIEITLLSCMIFASEGLYQTAASLASTILSNITSELRSSGEGSKLRNDLWGGEGDFDARVPLACKDLFLLRQYCERAVSFSQLRTGKVTLRSIKGDAVRNLARAQRDLDLAVMMNEEAERVLAGTHMRDLEGTLGSPTGLGAVEDLRLTLIHVSCWIDQYLSVLKRTSPGSRWRSIGWQTEESNSLRDRLDIWTAAGLVKDTEVVAWRASEKAAATESLEVRRYFSHLEARSYQNALTLFMVFLAFDVSSDVQTFWNFNLRPEREKVLVFRNWKLWFKRYMFLLVKFGFELRLASVMKLVFETLQTLEELRKKGLHAEFQDQLRTLMGELRKLGDEPTDPSLGFSSELADLLANQLLRILEPSRIDSP